MSGKGCENLIRKSLQDVKIVDIDSTTGRIVVETNLPWTHIKEHIESTGKRAVLTGFGGQSAVAIVDKGPANICGVIRFCSIDNKETGCVLDGVLDGLEPNKEHSVNVHECGDLTQGCKNVGDIYGRPNIEGNTLITADENGRTAFRFINKNLSVSEIIGRSVVVSPVNVIADKEEDNYLACGIIARSAGIFQNYKKICACDGVTIWDERDKPIAGAGRQTKS
jgi:copper chaperone for superoxide dismutase